MRTGHRAALGAIVAVLWIPTLASAHLGSRKYLRVEIAEGRATIEAEVEAIDASMELGLGEDVNRDALMARTAQVRRWLEEGIEVRAGTTPCPVESTEPTWRDRDDVAFLVVTLRYECGAGELALEDNTVFPDDPQHEALVALAWSDAQDAQVLRRGSRELSLGGPAGLGDVVATFLWEGVLHFATGYDHVLFLLSLVLAAGFVSRRDGIRKALRDVAILVTAFTLGHSVTLIAAALEVVVLPIKPVEIVIAASIVVVALLNLWRPEQRGPLPWLAVGFGLIHGFGFSSVLAELGLPVAHRVAALVSFNVGIELAQLAFVAVVLGPIAWMARKDAYPWVVRGSSVVIALLACFWVIERI
ncbi:MAG: HupE/UreJ family protein [Myxococcota bacterium]